MPLDLASVRASIANLLSETDELASIGLYEPLQAPTNNIPYASIRLGRVERVHRQMGMFTFDAEWRINVILGTNQVNAELDAQMLYETLISKIHDTFDSDSSLDEVGVVEWSIVETADMPPQPAVDGSWACQFILTTQLATT